MAIIIASAPGFAKFMRQYVAESRLVSSLRSRWGRSSFGTPALAEKREPNQPRTGRYDGAAARGVGNGSYWPNDAWLLKSGSTTTGEEACMRATGLDADDTSGSSGTMGGDKSSNAHLSPA